MSIKNRLSRLERATSGQRARNEELEQRAGAGRERLEAAWGIMQQSMSEEHARLVVEAYAAGAQYVQSPEFSSPAGRLLRRCLNAISGLDRRHWPYTEIAPEVVLAMPPALAEIYLAADELPLHECEGCGFHLPFGHFPACPLCGGRIGWYAYFNRRKAESGAAKT